MRPNKNSRQVISNLDGREEFAMGLDPRATGQLMDMLTDLYSDPELAVVREYATNARDSHIEAGNDAPIEVELPTRSEPTLVIRDYGLGMSKEDIEATYRLYGASTKRENDDVAGTLGVGCKSALTYTDQFTVVGTKDEVRTTVSVARAEDGGGKMIIVSEEEVPFAPNGVEIIVPAHNAYDFKHEVEQFFQFWPAGSVLIDGNPITPIYDKGIKITDRITAIHTSTMYQDYIVMGSVPYECDSFGLNNVTLVVNVDMGEIEFEPSREGLRLSNKTREAIDAIVGEYHENVGSAMQERIDEAQSKQAALTVYGNLAFLSTTAPSLTWRGESVPTSFKSADGQGFRLLKEVRRGARGGGLGAYDEAGTVTSRTAQGGLWVTGFTNNDWSGLNREKWDAYVEYQVNQGTLPSDAVTKGTVITSAGTIEHSDWLDSTKIIDWSLVKKFKLPNAGPRAVREKVAGTYLVWKSNDHYANKIPATDIDTSKMILFGGDEDRGVPAYASKLAAAYPGVQIAFMRKNRINKFFRDFPTARPMEAVVNELANDWWADLDDLDRAWIAWDRREGIAENLKVKDPEIIFDPDLRELLVVRKHKLDTTLLAYVDGDEKDGVRMKTYDHLNKRYPLVAAATWRVDNAATFTEHALKYINDTYFKWVQIEGEAS